MSRSLLRAVRTSCARRMLALLAALAATFKLSMLYDSGVGLVIVVDDPLRLDERMSSSRADLLAIHSLVQVPSGRSSSSKKDESRAPPGEGLTKKVSLGSVRTSMDFSNGLLEDADLLGKDSAYDRASLPRWINNYLLWHSHQLKQINESNWREFKYLVFRCRRQDAKCGGASDRIQPVPFGLMLANQTRRILLIDWTRPCRLEEFLVPPSGGINWTVPEFIQFKYPGNPLVSISKNSMAAFRDDMLIDVRLNDHGRSYYNAHRDDLLNEPDFDSIYHRVWKLFFVPSPPVTSIVRDVQRGYRLVPNQYVSVHIRAMYKADRSGDDDMVRNAIHCATQLRPGVPIFFASDSPNASSYAIIYGRQIGVKVSAQFSDTPPLHIDRGQNFLTLEGADWMVRNASDFYDTFVDLYLLAGGSCTAYNIGGYGKWASLISSNSSCFINHDRNECDLNIGNVTDPGTPGIRPRIPPDYNNDTVSQQQKSNKDLAFESLLSRRKKAPGWVEEGGVTDLNPS